MKILVAFSIVIFIIFLPELALAASIEFPGGNGNLEADVNKWYKNTNLVISVIAGVVSLIAAAVAGFSFLKGDAGEGWEKVRSVAIGVAVIALFPTVIPLIFS